MTISRGHFRANPIDLGAAPCDGPLKRAFEFDVTVCPLCGGTLQVIARALARQHRSGHHRQDPLPRPPVPRPTGTGAWAHFLNQPVRKNGVKPKMKHLLYKVNTNFF